LGCCHRGGWAQRRERTVAGWFGCSSQRPGLVGRLEAKLCELLLKHERIEADLYGRIPQISPPSAPKETAAPATNSCVQGSSLNHACGPHHSHSHLMCNSKCPAVLAFSLQHSRTTTILSPSSLPAARTMAPTLLWNHSTRGAGAHPGARGAEGCQVVARDV
jgi:hypothetical protein